MKVSINPQTGAIEIDAANENEWAIGIVRLEELAAKSKELFGDRAQSAVVNRAYSPRASTSNARSGTATEMILNALKEAQAPMHCNAIIDATGIHAKSVQSISWTMASKGLIVKTSPGTYALEEFANNGAIAGSGSNVGGERMEPNDDFDPNFVPDDD
jgi:hypothetical protein